MKKPKYKYEFEFKNYKGEINIGKLLASDLENFKKRFKEHFFLATLIKIINKTLYNGT